jgi:hypothetical protein
MGKSKKEIHREMYNERERGRERERQRGREAQLVSHI